MQWFAWLVLWTFGVAGAHPFGSTLYGHRTQVYLSRDEVRVVYLAEVPTTDLLKDLRAFLSGRADPGDADQAEFTEKWLDELDDGLDLWIDDVEVDLERQPTDAQSGVGDTRFIVFNLVLTAPLPEGAQTLNLVNGNLPGEQSLFSTELFVDDAMVIDEATLFRVEDGEIRADRNGQWRMEEKFRELRVAFHVRTSVGEAVSRGFRQVGGGDGEWRPASESLSSVERDPLQALVTGELTPGVVAFGLLLAVVLGAAHALSPGHGKALVAAYLLGSRQTIRHAVWLGVIVTVTHTAGVYLLGGVAWALEEAAPPEVILPWMEVASGLLVLLVGAGLIRSRLRASRAHHTHDHEPPSGPAGHLPPRGGGRIGVHHAHTPDPPPSEPGGGGPGHDHAHHHAHAPDPPPSELGGGAGAAGGGGLGHDHAHHHSHTPDPPPSELGGGAGAAGGGGPGHDHAHHHSHAPDPPPSELGGGAGAAGGGGPAHAHAHHANMTNEEHAREHAADYRADSWRELVLLGVSGGLAPCPSALVLLLTALSFHRLGFGLVLVFAFSVGLALLVTGIGVAVILLGDRVRLSGRAGGRLVRGLPVASAIVVTLLGVAITWRGVSSLLGG